MTGTEQEVAQHYTHGALEDAILKGLGAMGLGEGAVTPDDLAAIDEFHIGGRQATLELAGQLALPEGSRVLDIGSGLGGAARFFAGRQGWRVSGVDLTPEYVAVAEALTARVGLAGRADFRLGSALALPFEADSFDGATLLHVGMNIADKPGLCAEVHRVLRPGGMFGVYDVMRTGEGELAFPVPWAATPATSFVADAGTYRRALEAAGFTVIAERDRRELGLEFFRRIRERIAAAGPPPLGIHILMGREAPAKVANVVAGLERGLIAPVEMIARRAG